MKMQDSNRRVSFKTYNAILNYALENGFHVETLEGVLNDSYLIFANRELKIGKKQGRKYILLYPTFATAWSNNFNVLETDNDTIADEFLANIAQQLTEVD